MGNRPSNSTSGRNWPRSVRDLVRSSSRSNRSVRLPNDNTTNTDNSVSGSGTVQLRSNGQEGQGRRSTGNGRRTWRDKLNSCPDLQNAAALSTASGRGLCNSTSGQQQQQQEHQQPRLQQQQTGWEQQQQAPLKVNYKIYRSYSDLQQNNSLSLSSSAAAAENERSGNRRAASTRVTSCAEIPVIEVRVYRRSTETLSASTSDRRRAQSLPRGMELRRSLGSDLAGVGTTASGSSGDSYSRCGSTSRCSSHYTDQQTGPYSRSVSRKASMRSSMASIGVRVTIEELPDTATVRRKCEEFEKNFVTTFIDAFQCLAPLNQLAALSIATRPDRANQAVSLLQYLESEAMPVDLINKRVDEQHEDRQLQLQQHQQQQQSDEYCLTISLARYEQVQQLKRDGPAAIDQRASVSRALAEDLSRDAARELSRMFEYQLALINESVAFRLLARHAVDCILNATRRRSRIMDCNSLVRGVVRGRPPSTEGPMFVSVFIGSKELKWNLNEVFKKPALRREMHQTSFGVDLRRLAAASEGIPYSSSATSSSSQRSMSISVNGNMIDEWGNDCRAGNAAAAAAVWGFYTSPRCDPMKYGYRGQMVERDYVTGGYRVNAEDDAYFQEEITIRYDDFHRIYSPLRRLVGIDILCDYCAFAIAEQNQSTEYNGTETNKPSTVLNGLNDYVRRLYPCDSYSRDEVEISLKPLGLSLPDDILTSQTPHKVLETIRLAVEKKRANAAIMAAVTSTKNASGSENGGVGVRRAAIEVTQACDELSGKLQGEFDGMLPSSPYRGTASNVSTTTKRQSCPGGTGNVNTMNFMRLSLLPVDDVTITDV